MPTSYSRQKNRAVTNTQSICFASMASHKISTLEWGFLLGYVYIVDVIEIS